jgi:hypothetical protein
MLSFLLSNLVSSSDDVDMEVIQNLLLLLTKYLIKVLSISDYPG